MLEVGKPVRNELWLLVLEHKFSLPLNCSYHNVTVFTQFYNKMAQYFTVINLKKKETNIQVLDAKEKYRRKKVLREKNKEKYKD